MNSIKADATRVLQALPLHALAVLDPLVVELLQLVRSDKSLHEVIVTILVAEYQGGRLLRVRHGTKIDVVLVTLSHVHLVVRFLWFVTVQQRHGQWLLRLDAQLLELLLYTRIICVVKDLGLPSVERLRDALKGQHELIVSEQRCAHFELFLNS